MPQFKVTFGGVYDAAKAAHPYKDRNGDSKLTYGHIAKKVGLSANTVWKYLSQHSIIVPEISNAVLVLANYFGVDWRDIVESVEDTEEPEPEIKTPLLASA